MASQGSNVGINYGWGLGESGYNQQMDENWMVIDGLLVPTVSSATTTNPPATPEQGVKYLIPAADTTGLWVGYENHITLYDGTQWLMFPPRDGWEFRAMDSRLRYSYSSVSQTWSVAGGNVVIVTGAHAQGASVDISSTIYAFSDFSTIRVVSSNGTSHYMNENLASVMVSGNVVYFGDVVLTMTNDTTFTVTTVSGNLTDVIGII